MANEKDIRITTGAAAHDLAAMVAGGAIIIEGNDFFGEFADKLFNMVEIVLSVQDSLVTKHSTGPAPKQWGGGNSGGGTAPAAAKKPYSGTPGGANPGGAPSEKQVSFALSLIAGDSSGQYEGVDETTIKGMTKRDVSAIIENLKKF